MAALLRTGFGAWVRSGYAGTGGTAPVFQPVGRMQQIPLAFQRTMGPRVPNRGLRCNRFGKALTTSV